MIIIVMIINVRSWSLKSLSSLSALPGWAKPRRFLGTCSTESQSRCCTYLVPGHLLMKIMFFINRILMRDQNVCYWKYLFPFILIFIEILNYFIDQRSEVKDRAAVARRWKNILTFYTTPISQMKINNWLRIIVGIRLREHVEDPETLPILIFPEGTCINNTRSTSFYSFFYIMYCVFKIMPFPVWCSSKKAPLR